MNLVVLPSKPAGNAPHDLLSRLRHYQMIPELLRGIAIDHAIAPFSCTPEETELALVQFYQQHQFDSPESIETWLRLNHLAADEIEAIVLRPVLLEKFKVATWGSKLKSYFLKRKTSLDRVVYSLIRTQDQGLAQELYYRLQDNEQSFEELAHQFSEGDEKHTGGRIGPVPLSQPHPAIRHLLAVSQAGQFWSPRCIDEWFVIVRLDRLAPVQLNAAVEQYLLDELFEAWVQAEAAEQSQTFLQSLNLQSLDPLSLEEDLAA
jgi:parvulin-like peptidyl-prolyl isomerase